MKDKSSPTSLDRRQFLKTSSGVALFIGAGGLIPSLVSCEDTPQIEKTIRTEKLTAWVQLADNGQIIIYNPAAEMGQGSMTALPAIFAEEMDAEWDQVRVEFSPQVPEVYGSGAWGSGRKGMLTAGSRTVYGYYPIMRQAGAQARYILLYSAAQNWNISQEELTTEPGLVLHSPSGRKMKYAEIFPILQMPEALPELTEAQLKDPADFRLIGKDLPRVDVPAKVDGSAQFAVDLRLPDMVYGVLERGRRHGAQPTLKNEADILAMPGVIKIHKFDYAIGVIAGRLEQALAAKEKLEIEWVGSPARGFNSQEIYTEYARRADSAQKGEVVRERGDYRGARSNAQKVYQLDFKNDYVYHAQMEPLNAVVQVAADGQSAEVWVGSQQGFTPKMGVPRALGLAPEQVKINLQYLGGGLGRRSMTDFVEEAAHLAKTVAPRPLKLVWTREDDLTYGAYRPISLQRLEATTDAGGNLTGLSHVVLGDGDNLIASGVSIDYYNIPNHQAEIRSFDHGIRLKHWRSVGHGPNKYAIECLLDIIAEDQGLDPVAFRRRLMQKAPRALATLEKAAEMARWTQAPPAGRARGVASIERSGTLSTGICEISLDESTGKISVHHFWSAHDAGVVVQPDNVKAQVEGGIMMGLSSVLKEQLTIRDGAVEQSNFNDYQLLRFQDIPETIETAIIPSSDIPQGVGESGTPLVAGAVANAFFRLTGKRLLHLPFTSERVLEALKS